MTQAIGIEADARGAHAARLPWPWRLAGALALLAALAVLAVVIAYWGWRALGPPKTLLLPAEPADPAAVLLAANPFGSAKPTAAPAEPMPDTLAGDTRLLGVLAERDGKGQALFRLPDGSPRLVAAGEAITRDSTLVAVRPDGITIRDAGGERRLALRAERKPVTAPAATKTGGSSRSSACAVPNGFRGPVVRLNAELVQGLIAQPDSWRALVEPANGALVVRDESGFAAMLGLRKGDRIEQANGIALRVADDVAGAVLRPLAASEPVRLVGSRNGEKREMLLQNAGACAG